MQKLPFSGFRLTFVSMALPFLLAACGEPQAEQSESATPSTSVSSSSNSPAAAGGARCDSGTPSDPQDPCMISTVEQLQGIRDNQDGHFALAGDIDASATRSWNDGAGFRPIPTFTGSLDGNGFTISGLYINRPNAAFLGMFIGIREEVEIKDLTLEDVDVTGGDFTGALTGQVWGHVSGVHIRGNVQGGGRTGGITGTLMPSGTVLLSSVAGTVTGDDAHVGGLVGSSDGAIDRSWGTAVVRGANQVGGLVGTNEGSLANSYTIIGSPETPEETLERETGVGGLVGNILEGATITGSYTVSFRASNRFDFVGFGLYGRGGGADGVTSSYWADERRPRPDDLARDPAEMMLAETYEGWDFEDMWSIDEGNSYPDLVENSRF